MHILNSHNTILGLLSSTWVRYLLFIDLVILPPLLLLSGHFTAPLPFLLCYWVTMQPMTFFPCVYTPLLFPLGFMHLIFVLGLCTLIFVLGLCTLFLLWVYAPYLCAWFYAPYLCLGFTNPWYLWDIYSYGILETCNIHLGFYVPINFPFIWGCPSFYALFGITCGIC